MHRALKTYVNLIKSQNPEAFAHVDVLDVGSKDFNGNCREFFTQCIYTGVDMEAGSNVDIVAPVHEHAQESNKQYDTIICTEMLEHDPYWKKSILAMHKLLKPGGTLIITCATTGRKPHSHNPNIKFVENKDYYMNISLEMFMEVIQSLYFVSTRIKTNLSHKDLYFMGIKGNSDLQIT